MTWAYLGNGLYTCHSEDDKVTAGVTDGAGAIEWDTGRLYVMFNGAWVPTLINSTNIRLSNESVEPVASTTQLPIYRTDIDASNQALYLSKLENGVPVKIRVA